MIELFLWPWSHGADVDDIQAVLSAAHFTLSHFRRFHTKKQQRSGGSTPDWGEDEASKSNTSVKEVLPLLSAGVTLLVSLNQRYKHSAADVTTSVTAVEELD